MGLMNGVLAGVVILSALTASLRPAGAQPTVHAWLTTETGKQRLAPQHPIHWTARHPRTRFIIGVDDAKRAQQIVGFGASLTDSSAWLLTHALTTEQRMALMKELFDPVHGLGISLLRQPMGASDFSASGNYSYDDMPAGRSDPSLARFSIAHDQTAIIPLLQEARHLNPALKLIGTPWSPPGWMKTTDSMIGGSLRPDASGALAQYFVRYVQAYRAAGLPIYAVTPQNEPQYSPSGYPGMLMTAGEQDAFIKNDLGPAFAAAGLGTKILIYDHNWGDQNGGQAVYPQVILADPGAARYVAGIAFHCYSGDPSIMAQIHKRFPHMAIYQTECSGGSWQGDFGSALRAQLYSDILRGLRNWAQSAIFWNLALDQDAGPQNGGCTDCRGIVTVNRGTGSVTRTVDYDALGHFSRFVRPGARRIASRSWGAASINDVAFRNPDGSHVLVAYNDDNSGHLIAARWRGRVFSCKLPPGAAVTFTW